MYDKHLGTKMLYSRVDHLCYRDHLYVRTKPYFHRVIIDNNIIVVVHERTLASFVFFLLLKHITPQQLARALNDLHNVLYHYHQSLLSSSTLLLLLSLLYYCNRECQIFSQVYVYYNMIAERGPRGYIRGEMYVSGKISLNKNQLANNKMRKI